MDTTPTTNPTPHDHTYLELAHTLEQGAGADIWYDTRDFDDFPIQNTGMMASDLIDNTQEAMRRAAGILRALAAGTPPSA